MKLFCALTKVIGLSRANVRIALRLLDTLRATVSFFIGIAVIVCIATLMLEILLT